jgi:hypothetical protein
MTMNTTIWAWEQPLPCAPKFLLVTLCDAAGMSREYAVGLARFGERCGLSMPELLEALAYLHRSGHIKLREVSDTVATICFCYPQQDFEMSWPKKSGLQKFDDTPGWFYILGSAHGITKVGITTNLPERAKSLNTNAAIDVTLVWSKPMALSSARNLETAVLKRFADRRVKGEWLRAEADEVISAAKDILGAE